MSVADFSHLPYEIQFKYLIGLPYRNLLRYCDSNKSAQSICESYRFWSRKAKHDFGIPLEESSERNPAKEYWILKQDYENHPEKVIFILIRLGNDKRVMDLLAKIRFRHIAGPYKLIANILKAIFETDNKNLLINVLEYLYSFYQGDIPPKALADVFFSTIMFKPEWLPLMEKYYDINKNTEDFLEKYYDIAIVNEYEAIIEYLQPRLDPKGHYGLYISLLSNENMIDYFISRFPLIMEDRRNITITAKNLAEAGKLEPLKRLIEIAGNVINLTLVRNAAQRKNHVHIVNYINSLFHS